MLELKNISKQFGQHKIFDNYNLTVEEGKILAIVGPSGGGKTTLLRMLAGLETIDSGQIIYENEEIPLDQMESRNLLGFVFQDFQLFPHLTVLDNLTLSPIKTMGMSKEPHPASGLDSSVHPVVRPGRQEQILHHLPGLLHLHHRQYLRRRKKR